MSRTLRAASLRNILRQATGGSFTARARSLLAAEFLLLDLNGREFGRLQLRGASGTELRLGERVATFERAGRSYRMVTNSEEVLIATPKGRSASEFDISCGGQSYEARADLLLNLAVVSYRESGERAVRLTGGLFGRRYETFLTTEDGCTLLAAIFLLWYVTANRCRTYWKGSLAREVPSKKLLAITCTVANDRIVSEQY